MKPYASLLILVCFLPLKINAQKYPTTTYVIKGILVDSLTSEGEPYATIRIYKKDIPDKAVKMGVTGQNGKFSEKLSEPGDYKITLSSVGKKMAERLFVVEEGKKETDLGTFYTSEETAELKGVEIVAQKPLVKVDMDKIEYNIQDDPDAKTNNILEMLRKVPMVTVDGQDKIQVNGSSNFKVHVNGKPNNMMSNNPSEVLKSMPASSIKYIEVITQPGVKYDAEGVGGILNIVTIGGRMQGYTVTMSGNASSRGAGGGAYGTVQVGKFTVSGNYAYNYNNQPESYYNSFREDFFSEERKYLNSSFCNKGNGSFQYGNLEGSYEIDTLRLLTFSVNMYGGKYNGEGWGQTVMEDALHNPVYRYGMYSQGSPSSVYKSVGASVDYQRSFHKEGELLTFSYRLNASPNRNKTYVDYNDIWQFPGILKNQYTKGKATTDEHTFQVDYANPVIKGHNLEAGAKYIIRNSNSDSKYYQSDIAGNDYTEIFSRNNKYQQLQDILAAYAGYQFRIKKFGAKAGLRYEHTFMKVKYHQADAQDFKAGFDDLVPSLTLSYQIGQAQTLRASYNMRISRPGIWYLNPFVNRDNPMDISYGNPDLKTEKSHSFSATFSSFTQKFNINLSLGHTFVNNVIEDYSFVENGILNNTYANMGKNQDTYLSYYFNWNITPKTRIYLNGSLNYTDYSCKEMAISSHGFTFYCYGGFQQTLPWKIRLSLNGGGSTKNVDSQGNSSGYHFYSLGLSRSFIDDRLTFSLSCSNMFDKYNHYRTTVATDFFRTTSESKYQQRYFGLGISFRIGKLETQVKRAERTINNDDLKGAGGNSPGGASGD